MRHVTLFRIIVHVELTRYLSQSPSLIRGVTSIYIKFFVSSLRFAINVKIGSKLRNYVAEPQQERVNYVGTLIYAQSAQLYRVAKLPSFSLVLSRHTPGPVAPMASTIPSHIEDVCSETVLQIRLNCQTAELT